MSDSLRDQVLKAGLVTKKQATQVDRRQQQDQYQRAKGSRPPQTAQQQRAAAQAQAAKAARDKELNRERQARAEARARVAQLKQLVEQHRLAKPETDEYFNFVDGGKVRRIPVDAGLRTRLASGAVAIVRCDGHYDLVPLDAVAVIRERDANAIVALPSPADEHPQDDDPYKHFVVPDDLNW
jgi:uncharacterized protein YaiL (DUF2058 family)